jgi:hypothetical protein
MSEIQTFVIEESFCRLSKAAVWICVGFVMLAVALPFLPDDDRSSNPNALYVVSVVGTAFFGILGLCGFRIAQQLPFYSIALDNEGLWPAHVPRDIGLVRWERIHSVKERPHLQRLDLLDASGTVLIKLEYQLSDFETLRELLVQRTKRPGSYVFHPSQLAKSPLYHVLTIGSLVGFSLLGFYVARTSPLLGYGGVGVTVALILHEYLTTVSRLVVTKECLELTYPLHRRRIGSKAIADIRMGDLFVKGSRLPEVGIVVHGERKPIRLRGLGMSCFALHQMLTE